MMTDGIRIGKKKKKKTKKKKMMSKTKQNKNNKRSKSSSKSSSLLNLRLLVCSGNLGNAEPDIPSLEAWIPNDGNCREVLVKKKTPTYPLAWRNNNNNNDQLQQQKKSSNTKRNSSDDDDDEEEDCAASCFDLIVIGLQESTFIPKGASQDVVDLVVKDNDNHDKHPPDKSNSHPSGDDDVLEEDEEEEVDEDDDEGGGVECSASTKKKISDNNNPSTADSSVVVTTKRNSSSSSILAASLHGISTKAINTTKELLITNSTSSIHQKLDHRLPSYTRLVSYRRGEMRLIIYVKKQKTVIKSSDSSSSSSSSMNINNIQVSEESPPRAQNTGIAGLPNKGGICAEITIHDGTTKLSFVSCHLEANEGIQKYRKRCRSLVEIFKGTTTQKPPYHYYYPDVTLNNHYCFVLGDLNFRTRYQGHVYVEDQIEDVQALITTNDWYALNEADELQKALQNQDCLVGFQTPICNFPPTFKVERDQVGYKYQTKRTPSYTDRILWYTNHFIT